MNRAFSMAGREHDHDDFDVYRGCGGVNYEKLELLKALRLSQTRARDAERKAASLIKERDCVANALFHDSSQLFAYRQWVRLLEFQVLKAQEQQWKQQEKKLCCGCGRSNEVKKPVGRRRWFRRWEQGRDLPAYLLRACFGACKIVEQPVLIPCDSPV
ncbi:hypothetical protein OIU76_025001 [Salix suchowensis]|nr:hypothetical protein OIU76_025001 [Salix suchowensis]